MWKMHLTKLKYVVLISSALTFYKFGVLFRFIFFFFLFKQTKPKQCTRLSCSKLAVLGAALGEPRTISQWAIRIVLQSLTSRRCPLLSKIEDCHNICGLWYMADILLASLPEYFSVWFTSLNQKHICWNQLASLHLVDKHRLAQISVTYYNVVALKHKAMVLHVLDKILACWSQWVVHFFRNKTSHTKFQTYQTHSHKR